MVLDNGIRRESLTYRRMHFDHQLWYECSMLGSGDIVHGLINKMTIYKGWFDVANKFGWNDYYKQKFQDAEVKLRLELKKSKFSVNNIV